jgi:hypothetical protein
VVSDGAGLLKLEVDELPSDVELRVESLGG